MAFVVITLFCGYPLAMALMAYKERCVAILHRYHLHSRTIHLPPHNSPIFRAVSKKEISDDSMPTEPQFQLNHCTCIQHCPQLPSPFSNLPGVLGVPYISVQRGRGSTHALLSRQRREARRIFSQTNHTSHAAGHC